MRDIERRVLRLEQARGQSAARVHVLRPLPGESREDELLRVFGPAGPAPGQLIVTIIRDFDDEDETPAAANAGLYAVSQ